MYQMKKNLRWSALKAGILVTLSLAVVFLVVLYTGTLSQMVTPTVHLQAQFQDVKGLRKGAPVWFHGMEVGSVKRIRLDPVYGTIVTLSIQKSTESFIRSNAQAEIVTMGLLGDKYVELNPGSSEAGPLSEGKMIEGQTPMELTDVVKASNKAVEKVSNFITEVENLIQSASKGEGTLSMLIRDPVLYNSLVGSTKALESTLERIEKSRGTLSLLIEEDALYKKLMAAAASMEKWSDALNRRSGTLKKLIEDPVLYDRSLSVVSGLERIVANLEAGQGSLGKMLSESGVYENLDSAAKNLDAVLHEMDKGKGMARALLRDEELVGEVKGALTEIRGLVNEMKLLLKDMKENPEKYFNFTMF